MNTPSESLPGEQGESAITKEGLQALEAFYRATWARLDEQVKLFDSLEEKVSRHAVLLSLILGVLVVGLPTALQAFTAAEGSLRYAFGVSYALLLFLAFVALLFMFSAMSYDRWTVFPMKKEMQNYYGAAPYVDVLEGISEKNIECYQENEEAMEKKRGRAETAYRLAFASIALAGLSGLFYVLIRLL